MPLDNSEKRKMRRHIETNRFYMEHPMESIMDIPKSVCECGKWIVGRQKCKCESNHVYLDYSDTTKTVFVTHLPVGDL